MKGYKLTESFSEITIAVITHTDTFDEMEIIRKVGEAVKDEFCYTGISTALINDWSETKTLECIGRTDDGDDESREVMLEEVAIY